MRDWLWDLDWPFIGGVAAVVGLVGGFVFWIVWEVRAEATEPDAGWVTEKVYHPETETETCQNVGNVPVCTEHEWDEWWELRYCDDDGACGDAEVDWREYEATSVGDWFEQ